MLLMKNYLFMALAFTMAVAAWFWFDRPEGSPRLLSAPSTATLASAKEINRLTLTAPVGRAALNQIPAYQLPKGAINTISTDFDFNVQAEQVKKGAINYVHLGMLADLHGGFHHPQWNQRGIQPSRLKPILAAYNLPKTTGVYRMMYSNVFPGNWMDSPQVAQRYQEVYNAVRGYAIDFPMEVGWGDHPILLDLDLEEGPYTYLGVKTLCRAIREVKDKYPNVSFQVYCSSHNSLCNEAGGSEQNPSGKLANMQRYLMFKGAGVTVFPGTLPYFHLPSYFWNDPSHEPSVIGPGKLYTSQLDYASKSLHPIQKKLEWTDAYFQTLPAGHRPQNIEWIMSVYEGGNDGTGAWPAVGSWILESMSLWGYVTGSYRYGGGLYNWTDNRKRTIGQDYIEAGKWRSFQFNRFWNDPNTQYNLLLEFSLDNGKTWQTDKRPGTQLLAENQDPRPYIRGALSKGELLVVATAGQPTHLGTGSQSVLVRYQGTQFPMTLKSQTVHAATVSIDD